MIDDERAIPAPLAIRFKGYTAYSVAAGRSGADVFRLTSPGRQTLFLKRQASSDLSRDCNLIESEGARLRWLRRAGLPCAEVLFEMRHGREYWLLTSEVEGRHCKRRGSCARRNCSRRCPRAPSIAWLGHVRMRF